MQSYGKNPEQNLLALKELKSISISRSCSASGSIPGSGSGSGTIPKTGGDLRVINSFQGFGGLSRELANPEFQNRLALFLKPHEIESLKRSASSAYFTPELIVRFIWAMVERLGFIGGGNVLEPAAGTGAFLDFMPNSLASGGVGGIGGMGSVGSSITGNATTITRNTIAIEKDVLTSKILKLKHPGVQVINCGFEQFAAIPASFDLIIGNPPYSADKLGDVWQEEINDLAVHHAFVAKSSLMLKEGGLIAMVLPQFFMDNTSKHARDIIARNGVNLVCAFRLPDNCFANAKVSVDLVFLRKGKATTPWTKTVNSGLGNQPINEYFAAHPKHILGNLEVIRMYERWGLTCRAQGNLRTKLVEVYKDHALMTCTNFCPKTPPVLLPTYHQSL